MRAPTTAVGIVSEILRMRPQWSFKATAEGGRWSAEFKLGYDLIAKGAGAEFGEATWDACQNATIVMKREDESKWEMT